MITKRDVIQNSSYKEHVAKLILLYVQYRKTLEIYHHPRDWLRFKGSRVITYLKSRNNANGYVNYYISVRKYRKWFLSAKILKIQVMSLGTPAPHKWEIIYSKSLRDLILISDACDLLQDKITQLEIDNEIHNLELEDIKSDSDDIGDIITISHEL